jgi:regulator of sigma E protease
LYEAFIDSPVFTLLAFVFVLGVMIFIHELGHFLVAKLQKIKVHSFALGFGPRLLGFRRGDTDYRINILPLGGYVKLAGEDFDDKITGGPEEFLSRPKYQRLLVYLAGPMMNILLAVLIMAGSFMSGVRIPKYLKEAPVIGVVQEGSAGQKAGLRLHDRILSIDGKPTPSWEDAQLLIGSSPHQTLAIEVERGKDRLNFQVLTVGSGEPEFGDAGLLPYQPTPSLTRIEAGSPAENAGLQEGDIVEQVRVGDDIAMDRASMQAIFIRSEGKQVEFTLRRGNSTLIKTVIPVKMPPPGGANGPIRPRIGVTFKEELILEKYGPIAALLKSVQQNYRYTALTFDIIGRLITGKASFKTMSGPIDIAYYSGEAARLGWRALLGFMALVSLQLGVFNLLPIPILDGGAIFLMLLEGILRKDFSVSIKERIIQVGFFFLVLLMGAVIISDISKRFFK